MKTLSLVVALTFIAVPARAQLGGLSGAMKRVQQAQEQKQKLDDLTVNEQEERTIGEDVSAKIRQRFGVVQDPAVHKYVALVGTALAKESERPDLNWTFVVLDTDGVNAFASPGGLVHITRGALGLIENEGELAAVLAHEIGHVAHKHTVNAIQKNKAVQLGANETLSARGPFLEKIANTAYEMVLENAFNRGDEMDADKVSVQLTQKLGYAPATLADFLGRLDERNKDQAAHNGLFASHPETKERIEAIRKQAAAAKTTALGEARYRANVKYQPTPITAIALVTEGSAGLTGGGKEDGKNAKKEEEPKKKGFGLGNLKQTVAPEKQSTQVSASGGARGVGPDRAAKGGNNSTLVKTTISATDVTEFRKGIV